MCDTHIASSDQCVDGLFQSVGTLSVRIFSCVRWFFVSAHCFSCDFVSAALFLVACFLVRTLKHWKDLGASGADPTRRTSSFKWAELTCARRAASYRHHKLCKRTLRNTKNENTLQICWANKKELKCFLTPSRGVLKMVLFKLDQKIAQDRGLKITPTGSFSIILYNTMPTEGLVK